MFRTEQSQWNMSHIFILFFFFFSWVIPILFALGQEFVTNAFLWNGLDNLVFFSSGCAHHDLMR